MTERNIPFTTENLQIMAKTIYSKEHRTLVERLKQARKEAGLGQSQVAKLLGISQSNLSKMEAGQRRIDIVQLKAFAKVYKKRLDYFLR
jgi:transcriptional regulator with XRE-family HTH domain